MMKKKYIGGLALVIAGTTWAQAGSVTVETASKDNQGNYYGFTLALGSETAALTDPDGILERLRGESVSLDNVSMLTRSNSAYADAKLAVYSFVSDGNVGDFVGLSESASFAQNTQVNFQFGNLDLTVGERYQFLFVTADATETALTDLSGGAQTLLQLYQMYSQAWGISVTEDQYAGTLLPSGWGTYTSSGLNAWEGHRMPVAELTVSSVAIPESSAFGFLAGIGALLFVAAGRRRKKLFLKNAA